MVLLIADRPCLLADTGPFCRFAEGRHDQLAVMDKYLDERLWIAQDVAIELQRRSQTSAHAALARLQWKPPFPRHEPITITDRRMLQQIEDIVAGRRKRNPAHFMADRGEVATILLAKERGWPVLLDERWGTTFAERKSVETVTTEDLCVELTIAGKLSDDHAFDVFKRVYRTGRAEFDRRVNVVGARSQ
jgi:hypothetical protein